MSRIGEEIKRVRLQKGLSPKQLAKKLGVSEGYVLDVETGKKIINDDMIGRVSKALDFELGPVGLFASEDSSAVKTEPSSIKRVVTKLTPSSTPVNSSQSQTANEVWDDAFGNILKTVAVYDYSMDKILEKRLLPIEGNKVFGMQKDKVFYLRIEDEVMSGFRISKGDLAFCTLVNDFDNDGIYLIENEGRREVRQIKRLMADKALIVSNSGKLITETASMKSIKFIAKLIKLEIILA